ncbi:hypothetical protein DAPPUDRAFT_237915 [Daphnia pulex]|uniref:Uncharacterized protein n=1 Tax=Daphnia pulex TaxID=6669 RepID=E9G4S0_DAPPU|nr:hypothetical protein DAPPUDRAFT_237915 [Daphnia pulex]|eukprot:EFX85512.1 hypothetical protein DAPPUDRAFT_237915 [Daphnia pulex]
MSAGIHHEKRQQVTAFPDPEYGFSPSAGLSNEEGNEEQPLHITRMEGIPVAAALLGLRKSINNKEEVPF